MCRMLTLVVTRFFEEERALSVQCDRLWLLYTKASVLRAISIRGARYWGFQEKDSLEGLIPEGYSGILALKRQSGVC